jgi:hypothetical protein
MSTHADVSWLRPTTAKRLSTAVARAVPAVDEWAIPDLASIGALVPSCHTSGHSPIAAEENYNL